MQKPSSERTGAVQRHMGGYEVFIPRKLFPSGPDIELDTELIRLLDEARGALGELKGIAETLPNTDLFVAFYVRKEALLSSQIEGTQCSLDEVIQVDEKASEMKPVHEVVNYINAMNEGLEQLKTLPMSKRLLHAIHKRLLSGVRGKEKAPGQYKKSQNWIGPPGGQISESEYIPPPPEIMDDLMDDLEKYYHEKERYPVLIKAAIVHSAFETIHPYADGNGRLGRLLITFMLCEKELLNKPLLYLSLFFKEHRTHYYEHLMDVRFRGEWEKWIKFFLRGVRNASREAILTAQEILQLHESDRELIRAKLSKYSMAIPCHELLCRNPITSISNAAKLISSSHPTISKVFEAFVSLGILLPYGPQKERGQLYAYETYLEILRRGT